MKPPYRQPPQVAIFGREKEPTLSARITDNRLTFCAKLRKVKSSILHKILSK